MTFKVPLLGQHSKSSHVLTKVQGYVRARGGFVEINCPGLYEGPPLPWDKAKKIALKGLEDCRVSKLRKEYVRLLVPGQPERRGPPEQVALFFSKLLKASQKAQVTASLELRIFKNPSGS